MLAFSVGELVGYYIQYVYILPNSLLLLLISCHDIRNNVIIINYSYLSTQGTHLLIRNTSKN